MLKITPLSVKFAELLLSVSNNSVLVCAKEKIDINKLQSVKKVELFMALLILKLGFSLSEDKVLQHI